MTAFSERVTFGRVRGESCELEKRRSLGVGVVGGGVVAVEEEALAVENCGGGWIEFDADEKLDSKSGVWK